MAAMEAVFIAMMLVSSIAILTSLAPGGPSVPSAAQGPLKNIAEDALQAMQSIPTNDRYQNALSRVVAKAYAGNTTELDGYLGRTLPPGAGYRLWLDNGHARKLLAGDNESGDPRQSVSATRLWHPDWGYEVLLPGFEVVPATMSMPLNAYAVSQGALVKEGGVPITLDVTTSQASYTSSFVTSVTTGPSAALKLFNENGVATYNYSDPVVLPTGVNNIYTDSNAGLPHTSTFSVGAGTTKLDVTTISAGLVVAYTLTLTAPPGSVPPSYALPIVTGKLTNSILLPPAGTWSIAASGTLSNPGASSRVWVNATSPVYNKDWTFAVQELAGKPLPVGTNVTLYFPLAFTGVDLTPTIQAGWQNIQWGVWSGGQKLTADLASTLSGASRNLTVHADRGAFTTDAMYLVRAEMGNGTSSSATFAISGITALTTTNANPVQHKLYLATSKPLSAGAPMELGILLAYPSLLNNPLTFDTMTNVTVRAPAGTFRGVSAASSAAGWTYVDSGTLNWAAGTAKAGTNKVGVLNLTALVAYNTTSNEPGIRVPVTFPNGYSDKMFDATQPYLAYGAFPPASGIATTDGFPTDVLDTPTTVTSSMYTRSALVNGTATYNATALGTLATMAENMRVGLTQSTIALSQREAHVGETVTITANFTPLVNLISSSISSWQMEIDVFDPAQPFESASAWQPTLQVSRTAGSMPPLVGTTLLQANFTAGDDSFYGPHLVLAQAKYVVAGTGVVETARLPIIINVVPDGGQAETSLYWVLLEAWMPDWA
ncbi:MAG: hypothetical protein LC624_04785 [Halobacteriales archaeon]|nr:hypothetical protein [Halobacteriales archaeon]